MKLVVTFYRDGEKIKKKFGYEAGRFYRDGKEKTKEKIG